MTGFNGPCTGLNCHLGVITGTGCSGNERCPLEQLHKIGVLSLPWNVDCSTAKLGETAQQFTCADAHLIDQCIAATLSQCDTRLTTGLIEDLRAIFDGCGPDFCRELLPALKLRALMPTQVPF